MVKRRLILLALLFVILAVPCSAVSQCADIEFSYSYDIDKESIGFEDSDTCSGHDYFDQYAVNQNQWFAVYYRLSKTEAHPNGTFGRVHIDIFDDQGALVKEISFNTTQDVAIELTETSVLIYLQTHVMEYIWENHAIRGYQIANYDSVRWEILDRLRQKEATVGEWNYKSKAALHGYTKLIRENGEIEQCLVDLPGSGFTVGNTVVPGLLIGAVTIVITILMLKRKKMQRHLSIS